MHGMQNVRISKIKIFLKNAYFWWLDFQEHKNQGKFPTSIAMEILGV